MDKVAGAKAIEKVQIVYGVVAATAEYAVTDDAADEEAAGTGTERSGVEFVVEILWATGQLKRMILLLTVINMEERGALEM